MAKNRKWGICRNHDFIYIYNGAYWSIIDKDELKTFLGRAAEKMGINKYYARFYKFRDSLFKQFLETAHLPTPEVDKDLILVNLINGTFEINVNTSRLRPFDPNDFITHQLPFEYDPLASAPKFQLFLNEVLPDLNLQKILAEYLGYVFIKTSTLKLEKVLILNGSGANGKSVLFDIVCALFGQNNISNYSLKSLTNETGYYRAAMCNKLLNYASEIEGKLETNLFKQLASGEPIEARLPFGSPFIMEDYAKLLFNCNELPVEVEHTHAFYRRFIIIPFNITIPKEKQDKSLAQRIIKSELPGVFNWVLAGLDRLLQQGDFTISTCTDAEVEQFKKESDSVKMFFDENQYLPSINDYTPLKEFYNNYRIFCIEDGYKPVAKNKFKKRLSAHGIHSERKNIGWVVYCHRENH